MATEGETILLSASNVTGIYLCLGYSMLAHSPIHSRDQCIHLGQQLLNQALGR